MNIAAIIRNAVVSALRALASAGKFVTKLVWESGKFISKSVWEAGKEAAHMAANVAETAINLPLALANNISNSLQHSKEKPGQRTQQALAQQQQALAQQQQALAQQPQQSPTFTPEQALDRRVRAALRYAADLVRKLDSPEGLADAVGRNMKNYIDMMTDDERVAFLKADAGPVRAMVREPLFNTIDGIEPMAQKLSSAGQPLSVRQQPKREHVQMQPVVREKPAMSPADQKLIREFSAIRQRNRQQQNQVAADAAVTMA